MPQLQPAPKTRFVTELATLTATPEAVVRERVRALFDNGIGPRGHAPLSDSVMAAYLIAFIAAASHLESVEVAERYGRFRCVAIGGAPPAVDALNLLLPPLHVASLRTILAATLRSMASDVPPYVIKIEATSPPHDQFVMTMLPGGDLPTVDLTFGPATAIARSLKSSEPVWPIRQTQELDGRVLARLVHLASPDETTEGVDFREEQR